MGKKKKSIFDNMDDSFDMSNSFGSFDMNNRFGSFDMNNSFGSFDMNADIRKTELDELKSYGINKKKIKRTLEKLVKLDTSKLNVVDIALKAGKNLSNKEIKLLNKINAVNYLINKPLILVKNDDNATILNKLTNYQVYHYDNISYNLNTIGMSFTEFMRFTSDHDIKELFITENIDYISTTFDWIDTIWDGCFIDTLTRDINICKNLSKKIDFNESKYLTISCIHNNIRYTTTNAVLNSNITTALKIIHIKDLEECYIF